MTIPIKTALLSYGMSGHVFHAPLLKSSSLFDLRWIVQRGAPTARERWKDVEIVGAAEEVIKNPAVELVVVNTPNGSHGELARLALAEGKHVVVEKPFTITSEEAQQLISLATKSKRVLTVFQNRRWDGDFLTLQQVLKSGSLGRIVEVEMHYDRFRNYIEPGTWKEEPAPGSGIVYNLGSHMLDQMLTLFGWPLEIDARIGVQRDQGKVDDFYDIRVRYEQLYVIVKSTYLAKDPGPRYRVNGTKGTFVKYGMDPQEQQLKDGLMPGHPDWGVEPNEWWGNLVTVDGYERIPTYRGNYPVFYENLFATIRQQASLAVRPEESRDVIRLIEAAYESNRLRQAISLS